jgi:hypothetical protein
MHVTQKVEPFLVPFWSRQEEPNHDIHSDPYSPLEALVLQRMSLQGLSYNTKTHLRIFTESVNHNHGSKLLEFPTDTNFYNSIKMSSKTSDHIILL